MFSTVVTEIKSLFGRNFLLGVFFPVLIFICVNLALSYFVFSSGVRPALNEWGQLSGQTQVLLGLGLLVITIFLSYFLYNFELSLVRLFEGYLKIPVLSQVRINHYKKRIEKLSKKLRDAGEKKGDAASQLDVVEKMQAAASQKEREAYSAEANKLAQEQNKYDAEAINLAQELLTYPDPEKYSGFIMPTRFGNILRSAELYARTHYGIDSVVIWTRLAPLLKDDETNALEEGRTSFDFMLVVVLLAVIFIPIWGAVFAYTRHWPLLFLLIPAVAIAVLAYKAAIQSAIAYGEQIKVIFDLYRNDLLAKLKRPLPLINSDAEKTEWEGLSRLFLYNMSLPPSQTVKMPKPILLTHDIEPYHLITTDDIKESKTYRFVREDSIKNREELIGHYARVALKADDPVERSQVVFLADPNLISNTLVSAVSLNSTMILGANIQAGDVVSLSVVPATTAASVEVLFEKLLVVDVKSPQAEDEDFVVSLAVPARRWVEYLEKTHNAQLVLAKALDEGEF